MTKEDLIELEDDDKMVKKIKNEIFNLNDPSEFPRLFSDEEFLEIEKNTSYYNGIEHGIEKGEAIGIEKGIEQEKISNARMMKKENIKTSIISKVTGLDINTIMNL